MTTAVTQPYGIIFRVDLQKTVNQPSASMEGIAMRAVA